MEAETSPPKRFPPKSPPRSALPSIMLLSQLLPLLQPTQVVGFTERSIECVTHDSRIAGPQDIFVAIRGKQLDGRKFTPTLNVAVIIADAPVEALSGVTIVYVRKARVALAIASAANAGNPGKDVSVIGITGTNGKTTTAWMVEHILLKSGKNVGVIGTLGHRLNGQETPLQDGRTTPEASTIQPLLQQWKSQNCDVVVMEVSSIGLELHRADEIPFSVVAFTNFSRDHLGFHETMDKYLKAKKRLFTELTTERTLSVINGVDENCREINPSRGTRWLFGNDSKHEIYAEQITQTISGITADIRTPAGKKKLHLPVIGRHNLENAMVAIGCALGVHIPLENIVSALQSLPQTPGRLERVHNPLNLPIFVDYAHTPDALSHVLQTLSGVCPGKLITVFGCGGDRDSGKRPEMGRIAQKYSDIPIVTSDNPRSEDPMDIIAEVCQGMEKPFLFFIDRAKAIEYAISIATIEDIVLIAGKGHELYQEIQGQRRIFDDREQARLAVKRRNQ